MHIDTNVHVHFATLCIFVFEDDENKATGLQFLPLKVSFFSPRLHTYCGSAVA